MHSCRPRVLSLPSQDEHVAMDHVEVLRMNGFELLIDEDAEVGQRVKLIALPVSKGTEFSVDGK
jgi:DNA mismatch repair protein PMS2